MIKPVTAMNTLQSNPLTQSDIDDVNIESIQPLVTPAELKTELPLTENAYQTVLRGRETIRNILDGKDKRLFVVIGRYVLLMTPAAAHEYADRLKVLSEKVKDSLYIVMRVYS